MLGPCRVGLLEGPPWSLLIDFQGVISTVLVGYKDPAGILRILLEYILVSVDFPYSELLEYFLQWECIDLFHEPHHRWYNL